MAKGGRISVVTTRWGEEAAVEINSTDALSPVDMGPHLKKTA